MTRGARHLGITAFAAAALAVACGDSGGGTATDTGTTAGPGTGTDSTVSTTPATDTDSMTDATAGTESTGTGTSTGTDTDTDPSTTDPTTGTGADGMYCVEECSADADCQQDGVDVGFSCVDSRCVVGDVSGICADDDFCQRYLAGWYSGIECASQMECSIGQACIDVDGKGRCAPAPDDVVNCEMMGYTEVDATAIEGGTIAACVVGDGICVDGEGGDPYCFDACSSDDECFSPSHPSCDLDTGLCACSSDEDCMAEPGASVCDAGVCKCVSDDDCAEVENSDVCHAQGFCGCSDDSVCPQMSVFDGAVYACKG